MSSVKDITAIKENMATLVANQAAQKERLDRIIPYLEEGTEHRTQVLTKLGVIENSVATYQTACAKEREGLRIDVDKLKLNRATETGKNSAYAAVISFGMVIGGWITEKIWK
jgi:Tfp pilus assembly ATPase PilU